ncbi:6-bladed beta-propeller [Sphingobacterium sp. HJSM2_6]|uniref:6-bladed beta-propeller n=1 Tax=Sphingobacterium sp. HJSM2_6 TaxID=3366264 RepID=UPI003BE6E51D
MRKVYLSIFFLFFLYSNSHGQRLIHDPSIPVIKNRIILEQTRGGTVSENLTDLEYIPLKTQKGDVIDYIIQTVIIEDRIGILNNTGGFFYIFDNKGNQIKKIDKIEGYKPPNKERLVFSVETKNNQYVLNMNNFRATLDKDGNLLDTTSKRELKNIDQVLTLGKNDFFFLNPTNRNDSTRNFALKKNDSILVTYDNRDTISMMFSSGSPITKINDNLGFISYSLPYKVFELDSTGITRIHQFLFPFKNTVDTSEYIAFRKWDDRFRNYMNTNRDKILGIGNAFPYKDNLILRLSGGFSRFCLAYNFNTKEILGLHRIMPDKSNDYLNFYDNNQMFVKDEFLYSFILPDAIRRAKSKCEVERHSMRKEYADLEKFNNPILVRFKLK